MDGVKAGLGMDWENLGGLEETTTSLGVWGKGDPTRRWFREVVPTRS